MLFRFLNFKFDKEGDGKPGGGDPAPAPKADPIAELKATNEALMKRLEALEEKSPKPDDSDLSDKLKKQKDDTEKKTGDSKKLESALRFSLGAKQWVEDNQALLPKGVASIFDLADAETYDSAIEKDASIKSAIIKEFFSVQDNVDLLTGSQKALLEDFLKLTKNAKQERSQNLYDSVFEPTFEMLKKLEKAKQVSGGRTQNKGEDAYKQRLIDHSRRQYLGEKK
jgi:hypothetical protein